MTPVRPIARARVVHHDTVLPVQLLNLPDDGRLTLAEARSLAESITRALGQVEP